MLKRINLIFLLSLFSICLFSCANLEVLRILNWGEYISLDLVERFEKEYNCKVKLLQATSNEMMYTSIITRRSNYDIAVPSDYMIEKLKNNDLIYKLDFTRFKNYKEDYIVDEINSLINTTGYSDYFIPYFWGALGIMYNKRVSGLEELIQDKGYEVFFNSDIRFKYKVGMYDSSRDSFASALLYLNKSLNTTKHNELLEARDLLKNMKFNSWKTDSLKMDVSSGNLDYALVYSGDYFDMLAADLDGNISNIKNYGVYCPTTNNNVFCDGLVIPKTSINKDLAYKFLDFMLDTNNMYENVCDIGYSPTYKEVKDLVFNDPEMEDFTSVDAYFPHITSPELYRDLDDEYYEYLEELYKSISDV